MSEREPTSVHRFSFVVKYPADDTFEYLIDPSNLSQWLTGVKEVDNPPSRESISAGTRVDAQISVLGIPAKASAQFTEFDRSQRRAVLVQTLPKGGQITSHLKVDDLQGSSLVYFEHHIFVPEGVLARIELSVIAKAVEHAAEASHANVVNILESGAANGLKDLREELLKP